MGNVEQLDELKSAEFARLAAKVQACRQCLRMENRTRVLGHANGPIDAAILFVAEAPGRLGADRTGVPLFGDRAGRDFSRLLEAAEIARNTVFVTNAVLCNPRDAGGRNAPPTTSEIANCRAHLQRTIELVDPLIVVSLGVAALSALSAIEPHSIHLATDVGKPVEWFGRTLVPLYHPGARAQIRRPLPKQLTDYVALGELSRSTLAKSRETRILTGVVESNQDERLSRHSMSR
jgi:uracil-DNA glycosylase